MSGAMIGFIVSAVFVLAVVVYAVVDFRRFSRRRMVESAERTIWEADPLFAREIGITDRLMSERASRDRMRAMMRCM